MLGAVASSMHNSALTEASVLLHRFAPMIAATRWQQSAATPASSSLQEQQQ